MKSSLVKDEPDAAPGLLLLVWLTGSDQEIGLNSWQWKMIPCHAPGYPTIT